jgi:LysM repeat protein
MIKLLFFAGFAFFSPEPRPDSVGTEIINGKVFVLHRVEEKETLYAISRRYGVPVSQIVEYNPAADAGLEVGQILKVPYIPRSKAQPVQGNIHKVAEKETLFSISRMYNVTVDELKQWNNLTDNSLSVGQELVVKKKEAITVTPVTPTLPSVQTVQNVHTVAAKETLFSIAKQYGVTVQQIKEWNNLTTEELKIGQQLLVAQPVYNQPVMVSTTDKPTVETSTKEVSTVLPDAGKPVVITESVRNTNEIVESGLAELIEGTEANRKYLALHRTAPVGTILKVRNEMNGREVFVRVIGKLPDTALTDKLIIRISKSAYDRLGAIDPRFRVEVTFYK